jgi:hypothetical protein
MPTYLATVATCTGLCAAGLPLIQVRKMLTHRTAGGVSVVFLAGAGTNAIVWVAYGTSLHSPTIALPALVSAVMCATQIAVATRLNRGPAPHPVASVAKAVVDDPRLAAEFRALVDEHEAHRRATDDTLILVPRTA